MDDQKEKLLEYFKIIERHIFEPIENSDLSKSCYATIILLFSVIDGLGKLQHKKKEAKARERFKNFLVYLGKDYTSVKDRLWDLRNSLVHNGINNISYMSATLKGEEEHLKSSIDNKYIFISSSKLLKDVKSATTKLKEEILNNEEMLKDSASRLDWKEDDPSAYWHPFSTPPGPIRFINI
jgi:hypothetical protein